MRFDALLRSSLHDQIGQAADRLKEWQDDKKLDDEQEKQIAQRIQFFQHSTQSKSLHIGGVDGSGDFPVLSFEDTFVYFAVAHATRYRPGRESPIEVGPELPPVHHLTWLPEDEEQRTTELDETFQSLAGRDMEVVVADSDYRILKARHAGRKRSTSVLIGDLVRPHASDTGNLAIQLRSTAELGAALSLIEQSEPGDLVLIDGTLSLPFVSRPGSSLFHEHLKRLCCIEARDRNVCFAALSKSHGLPAMEAIEDLAREQDSESGKGAEHWYLRLPVPDRDEWTFTPTRGRLLPPPGTVTYLVRFHTTTPVMRLDLDRIFWEKEIDREDDEATVQREQTLFEKLDYMSHDMRSYGYPYPLKAAHDRASLTKKERDALRSTLVNEAMRRGISHERLRSASVQTGHA